MKIKLPKSVLGELPAPDSQGVVRVTASLRIGEDGTVELTEINDSPVADEDETDDENPMPEAPSLEGAPQGLY